MEKIFIDEFMVVGISIKTTNKDGKSAKDIKKLWEKFILGKILDKIPNKISNSIYLVYSDYVGDYTEPYTVTLACKVKNTDGIPNGMIVKKIKAGSFIKFIAKGDLNKGIVYDEWVKIWNSNLSRRYSTDFEIYSEKAQNPNNAEVEIFVAVK